MFSVFICAVLQRAVMLNKGWITGYYICSKYMGSSQYVQHAQWCTHAKVSFSLSITHTNCLLSYH